MCFIPTAVSVPSLVHYKSSPKIVNIVHSSWNPNGYIQRIPAEYIWQGFPENICVFCPPPPQPPSNCGSSWNHWLHTHQIPGELARAELAGHDFMSYCWLGSPILPTASSVPWSRGTVHFDLPYSLFTLQTMIRHIPNPTSILLLPKTTSCRFEIKILD